MNHPNYESVAARCAKLHITNADIDFLVENDGCVQYLANKSVPIIQLNATGVAFDYLLNVVKNSRDYGGPWVTNSWLNFTGNAPPVEALPPLTRMGAIVIESQHIIAEYSSLCNADIDGDVIPAIAPLPSPLVFPNPPQKYNNAIIALTALKERIQNPGLGGVIDTSIGTGSYITTLELLYSNVKLRILLFKA